MAVSTDSRFAPLPNRQASAERITTPPISFAADAWRRFKANPMALLGLIVLVIFLIACFIGPLLTPWDPTTQNLAGRDQPPSLQHWFGTDAHGRDLFERVLYGGRISLAVAFFAGLLQLVVGVAYGATAGLLGGKWDNIMMRIVDIIDTIPLTIYVILLAVILGQGLTSIFIAIGIVYWTSMARLVRAQVLSLKEQEFMLAARALGANRKRLIFRHLIPNAMAPIVVELTFSIPPRCSPRPSCRSSASASAPRWRRGACWPPWASRGCGPTRGSSHSRPRPSSSSRWPSTSSATACAMRSIPSSAGKEGRP